MSSPKERLPARDGIGSNDRTKTQSSEMGQTSLRLIYSLRGFKVQSLVFRGTTVVINEFFTEIILYFDKVRLMMSGRQRLRQLLDRGRKAVIGLIARCPECVTTSVGGRLEDLQNGIVGWDVLKGDATRNLAIC